jgi:hypothetical protein
MVTEAEKAATKRKVEALTINFIVTHIKMHKWEGLTDTQKSALVDYVYEVISGFKKPGTFRYLVYEVLHTFYDTDFMDLNNTLISALPKGGKPKIVEIKPTIPKKCQTCMTKHGDSTNCTKLWHSKPKYSYRKFNQEQCKATCPKSFCCTRGKHEGDNHECSVNGKHTLARWKEE